MTDQCEEQAGRMVPVVNRNRCEAKGPCTEVCPYDVFEIQPLREEDRKGMSLIGKLKSWAHGNQQAYVVNGDRCHACMLCVAACPEGAIRLVEAGKAA